MHINNSLLWSIVSLFFLLFFLVLGIIIYAENSFAFTFFILLFLLLSLVNISKAVRINRIIKEEGIIAHWIYNEYIDEQNLRKKKHSAQIKTIFIMCIVVFCITGLIYSIFWIENHQDTTTGVYFLIGLIGSVCFSIKIIGSYRNLFASNEAFICSDCVWIKGRFIIWNTLFKRFNSCEVIGSELVVYYFEYYHRWIDRSVKIPIPNSKEEEAIKIAEEITQSI